MPAKKKTGKDAEDPPAADADQAAAEAKEQPWWQGHPHVPQDLGSAGTVSGAFRYWDRKLALCKYMPGKNRTLPPLPTDAELLGLIKDAAATGPSKKGHWKVCSPPQ